MQDTTVAQNLGSIRYSRGNDKYDNHPEQCSAADFNEFVSKVLGDRSPRKGMAYITAPMSYGPHDDTEKHPENGHYRLGSHAEARRYLPLDFDGFRDEESFFAAREYLSHYSAVMYTTASHTDNAPRARGLVELSRAVKREEGLFLGMAFQMTMKCALGSDSIKFDESVYRAEQPCYTPVTTSQVWKFDGVPLDVDAALASYTPSKECERADRFLNSDLICHQMLPETVENVQRVRDALALIPSAKKDGCDRDMYLSVIWSIASLDWSCGERLAREWCLGSPVDFDERAFDNDWSSFDSGRVDAKTIGTLFYLAQQFAPLSEVQQVKQVGNTSDWPDLVPINSPLPDVASFNFNYLPDTVRSYVKDQSELMQSPPDYIAAGLMVSLAAAIGNTFAIAPKAADTTWLVAPVLWGGVVGRPSTLKTPSINRATYPLTMIEETMAEAFEKRRAQHTFEKLQYEVAMASAKAAAKKGAGFEMPLEPEEPKPERLLVNDSTYQQLTEILRHSPRGVMVLRDELVSMLTALSAEGQEGARGFYLEAWNGLGSYRVDRVGRGSFVIPRVALWLFGGIQPGKLEPYVRGATHGGISDDGLLQRFQLIVWPDQVKEWKNIDRQPDMEAMQAAEDLFVRLRNLNPVAVGATVDPFNKRPAYLHFTSEAQEMFDKFRVELEASLRHEGKHPALESHLAKYRSLVPALALVIHLADNGTGPVTNRALKKAIGWSKYLWSHARRVYSCVTNSAGFAARSLADRIASGKLKNGFTAREVLRAGWQHLNDADDVRHALEWLIDAGWLRSQVKPTTERGGRSTETFLINPAVLNG